MLSVTAVHDLRVSPGEIWSALCDIGRYADWVVGTAAVTRHDATASLGATYEEINPILGPWKARTEWRVSEYDEGRSMVHVCNEFPMAKQFQVRMKVEPTPDGGRVTLTLAGVTTLGPVGWLFARVMTPRVSRDNERSLANLARHLGSG